MTALPLSGAGHAAGGGFRHDTVAGLKLWICAGLVKNQSGYASQVFDKSGNGNDLVQATPDYRPAIVASAINGQPVLRFDGDDEFMWRAGDLGLFTGDDVKLTSFVVYQHATGSLAGNEILWSANNDTTYHPRHSVEVDDDEKYVHYKRPTYLAASQVLSDAAQVDTDPHIRVDLHHGTTVEMFRDGGTKVNTTTAQDTAEMPTIKRFCVAARHENVTAYYWNGDIAEVLIYAGDKSAADINLVGAYLEAKYGITWTNIT